MRGGPNAIKFPASFSSFEATDGAAAAGYVCTGRFGVGSYDTGRQLLDTDVNSKREDASGSIGRHWTRGNGCGCLGEMCSLTLF